MLIRVCVGVFVVHDLPSPWIDVFPIRRRDAFSVFAARRAADGRPVTVVTSSEGAELQRAHAALRRLYEAHAQIEHPRVARATAFVSHDERPFVELDVSAVTDAGELLRLFPTAPRKIPYAAADAFIATIRQGLSAGHAHGAAAAGAPFCLGRFSACNILFDADGWWSVVGFGHNVACFDEFGVVDGSVTAYHAPEVAAGADATPGSDYVALISFMRSVLQYVSIPDVIASVLRGVFTSSPKELIAHLRWFESRVMAVFPGERASVEEAVDVSARIRALTGQGFDPEGFAAHAAWLMREGGIPPAPRVHRGAVVRLARDASWVMLGGDHGQRLKISGAQRRMLQALLSAHSGDPTHALGVWDLFEAGWPGERAGHEASLNRVYVGLSRIREKGLRDAIERYDDGWRFSPAVVVRVEDP